MNTYVFDIEANGLKPTKIHCLSAKNCETGETRSTTDYDQMRKFFTAGHTLIGHDVMRYDIPVVEKLLGIKIVAKVCCTLALSWYLRLDQAKHGLAHYGELFGVPKPIVEDWENLPIEVYINRCEEDVKINWQLWEVFYEELCSIYGSPEGAWKLIDYVTFKMKCASLQLKSKWKLDLNRAIEVKGRLVDEKLKKVDELASVMPDVPVMGIKKRPKMTKKDGGMSALGEKWLAFTKEQEVDPEIDQVEYIRAYKKPNPNSTSQVKKWLDSLGWIPETFEFSGRKKIPQINQKRGGGICDSIKELYSEQPKLELLDGLSILTHRISILTNFLRAVDDEGYIQASITGFTNTLRFKHTVIVNLPKPSTPYGEDIRGCLIAPEDQELCGSDMSSLEDRTKQHFMYDYDPDYVKEMAREGFDPHIDLAIVAGAITEEEVIHAKSASNNDPIRLKYSEIRPLFKQTNYSCIYGAKASTVARNTGMTVTKAKGLVAAYWKRNWAVKEIPKHLIVKTYLGNKWQYNPVSELWYRLKTMKDQFSTLNQGTGTYCFDRWVWHILDLRSQLTGQMHDEIILTIDKGKRDSCKRLLRLAIDKTNEELQLNVKLDVDVQFGDSYAEIH